MANQKAISLPFSISQNYGIAFSVNENEIWKHRVFIAVMTRVRERIMRANYGTRVKDAIFEDEVTASSLIKTTVESAFANWLSSLTLINIDISLDTESMQLAVTISYRLPNNTTDEITLLTGTFNRSGELIQGS